jgi:NAD(P)H-nitrite reductase large subunit
MKAVSEKYGLKSVEELKQYFTFGENCKLCIPYVELMLKTGKTEFEPMDLNNRTE